MTQGHDQTSPPLESGRHGGVFRFGGVPPREQGPGGGGVELPPPGRLSRRVRHIMDSNVEGSLLAPLLFGGSSFSPSATTKGTA